MKSTVVQSNWWIISLICLIAWSIPSLSMAQSDSVKTISSKTGTDDKSDADDKLDIEDTHPLYKLLLVAQKAKKVLSTVEDYECVFAKKELLTNKKLLNTTMNLKFRETPFSVYLKFLDPNTQGREVIFVQGQNNNNLLVHEAGIKAVLGTFELPPTGPDAMAENKYPVTSIGMKKMLVTLMKQWEAEGKFAGTTTQKRPNSKLPTGEVCTVYESIHDKPFKEFKFHITRLWIDNDTGLPIGLQQLAFPAKKDLEPPIVEEYFYTKIKTNLKLTDKDFDKNNSSYAFR